MIVKIHGQKGNVAGHVAVAETLVELDAVKDIYMVRQADVCRIQVAVTVADAAGCNPCSKEFVLLQKCCGKTLDPLKPVPAEKCEADEVCVAIKEESDEQVIYESADLLYHTLVGLGYRDISPDRVKQELARRFGLSGIEEKEGRKK